MKYEKTWAQQIRRDSGHKKAAKRLAAKLSRRFAKLAIASALVGCGGLAEPLPTNTEDTLQVQPPSAPLPGVAPQQPPRDAGPAICGACHDRERFWACDDGGLELRWCWQHPESPLCQGSVCK